MLNTTTEKLGDLLELAREYGINAALYVIDSQHREAMDAAHDQLLPNNDTPRGLDDQQMSDYMDRALAHMREELRLLAADHAAFRAWFIGQARIVVKRR